MESSYFLRLVSGLVCFAVSEKLASPEALLSMEACLGSGDSGRVTAGGSQSQQSGGYFHYQSLFEHP